MLTKWEISKPFELELVLFLFSFLCVYSPSKALFTYVLNSKYFPTEELQLVSWSLQRLLAPTNHQGKK